MRLFNTKPASPERTRSEREREAVKSQNRELRERLDRLTRQVQQLTPVRARA